MNEILFAIVVGLLTPLYLVIQLIKKIVKYIMELFEPLIDGIYLLSENMLEFWKKIFEKNKNIHKKEKAEKTRITISFRSKNQSPLLMIVREYYDRKTKEITYAEVLFEID